MGNGFSLRNLDAPQNTHAVEPARPAFPVRRPQGRRFRMPRGGWRLWLWRGGAVLLGGGFVYAFFLWWTLPDISDPRSLIAAQSSVIVDRNQTELYRLYDEENRTFIPGDQIPQYMKHAIVAIEDERFYERGCLDIRAIARAFFRFGQAGGASTLTRQLARNALDLKQENLLNRKLKELILGCQLESRYAKDELVNLYLNWIPFGQNAYGIELASRSYFDTAAKDLTLAQSAILAALPQRPSYFSPYGKHVHTTVTDAVLGKIASGRITKASQISDSDVTIGLLGDFVGTGSIAVYVGGRTDQVLRNMQDSGFITEAQRLKAQEELSTIVFTPSQENIRAPHFVLWVKAQVEELLAGGAEAGLLSQGGLTIETTLDWDMQQAAEQVVRNRRDDIGKLYEGYNIALVAAEVGTNHILAYVGNANYQDDEHDGKIDMARAPRQPGSSFKPLVYAAAFERGYGPATVLYDVPTKIGNESPQNFDGGFWGLMNMRKALAASRNIPAIKAYFLAGEDAGVLDMAQRLGASSPTLQKQAFQVDNPEYSYGWPLALGAGETPLLEMAQAYATFADGGILKPLVSIRRITDRRGNILFESDDASTGTQVIDPRIAYQITSILSDTAARPNEFWQSTLSVPGMASAAKTGTSNKCLKRDAKGNCTERKPDNLWTMGYTPNIIAGVWIGNADATPLSSKAESLSQAAPLWQDFMIRAHKLLESPVTSFKQPTGLVQPQISTLSGQLPTACTPVAYRAGDLFLQERAPTSPDPACVQTSIDRVTGLLASPECPVEAAKEMSFFSPREVLAERFPEWQQGVLDWAGNAMKNFDPLTGAFSGTVLPLPLLPSEKCSLTLTPGRDKQPSLTISSPQNGGAATYPSFQPQLDVVVGSSIREITATIDGKAAGAVSTAPFRLRVRAPRSVSEGGSHILVITLIDEYYNTVSKQVSFRFEEDIGAPTVRFLSPSDSLTSPSGVTLRLEADAKDDGGIKYVEFFVNDLLLTTRVQSPFTLDWEQTLQPGTYELRAVATDLSGNKTEDAVELIIEPKE